MGEDRYCVQQGAPPPSQRLPRRGHTAHLFLTAMITTTTDPRT